MKKIILSILIVIISVVMLSGCTYKAEKYVFGTYYSIKIEGNSASKQGKKIDSLFEELDKTLSTSNTESDLSKVNSSKANQPTKVSSITVSLFKLSKELYKATNGAFNPALFPLTELWCFSPSTYVGGAKDIPSKIQIDATLPYCDFNLFILNEENLTITKKHDKAKLDFGAIAKGYATDLAYEQIKDQKNAVIDVGRTYRVKGSINLLVADPRGGDFVARATLCDKSVATSGDYERYYVVNNKRYHHIISFDGYPSGTFETTPIISATVIGESATVCDALSTASMVLGYEKSKTIIEKYGYSALLLTENGYYSIGENLFEITDKTRTKLS